MNDKKIIVEKKGRLTIITINRPEAMNALDPDAHFELDKAFNAFSDDPEMCVAILTATGDKVFCAGNDLKYQQKHGSQNIIDALEKTRGGFGAVTGRFDCYKPIIAAVNGFALGGGTEIALACDIIIAAEHAKFGLPEPRVGLFAGAGGLHRLPRQVPYHWAMGYVLTGRQISAQEALRMGMLNEVVPVSSLRDTAERWADDIIQCSPIAIKASKQLVQEGMKYPLEDALGKEYYLAVECMNSEDLNEGVMAFNEKRKPKWKGR